MLTARFAAWMCIASAILIHAAGLVLAPPDPLAAPDAANYWFTAETLIAEGQFRERFDTGSVPTSWRPPLTALSLAAAIRVGLEPGAIVYLNLVLLAGTLSFLLLACRRLGLPWVMVCIVTLGYALHPYTLRSYRGVASEPLFLFLCTGSIALALAASSPDAGRRRHLAWIATAGVMAGLALLSRTVMIALLPGLIALCVWRCGNPGWKWRGFAAAIFVAGFLLPVAPWQARNARVNDHFVFVNTAGVYNSYIGTVHNTAVLQDSAAVEWVSDLRAGASESAVAARLRAQTLRHVRDNPGVVAMQAAQKGVKFWFPSRRWPPNVIGGLLLLSTIVALARYRRYRTMSLVSMTVLLTVLHMGTFSTSRMFLPALVPSLLVFGIVILESRACRVLTESRPIRALARRQHR